MIEMKAENMHVIPQIKAATSQGKERHQYHPPTLPFIFTKSSLVVTCIGKVADLFPGGPENLACCPGPKNYSL